MSNYIHVFVTTDDDAMLGGTGSWDGINEKDTIDKFAELILNATVEAYPDADVEVETYAPNQHVETDIDGADEVVLDIISDIYNAGEFWIDE